MTRKYGKKRPAASAAAAATFGSSVTASTTTTTITPAPTPISPQTSPRQSQRLALAEMKNPPGSIPILETAKLSEITELLEKTTLKDHPPKKEATAPKKSSNFEIVIQQPSRVPLPPPSPSPPPIPISALDPLLTNCLSPLLTAYKTDRGIPLTTKNWNDVLAPGSTLEKIAEASYAEVFRITNPIGSSILKLLRLKVPTDSTSLKSDTAIAVETVVSEMRLMNALTEIPGFVKFKDAHIVEGQPPSEFITAYESHLASSPDSESYFPHPADIPPTAIFLAIELGDAGIVLEQCKLTSTHQLWDIFLGIIIALARAELEFQFEHRDLHENNICILHTTAKNPSSDRRFGKSDVEVTILDYGLSRATLPCGETVFYDLEQDICVFQGQTSDPIASIQFSNYRRMRSWLYSESKTQAAGKPTAAKLKRVQKNGKTWEEYIPYTNALWIYFLLEYLTTRYKGRGKKGWKEETRDLREALDPDEGWLEGAGDVLQWAFERGWVGEEDLDEVERSILREDSVLSPCKKRGKKEGV